MYVSSIHNGATMNGSTLVEACTRREERRRARCGHEKGHSPVTFVTIFPFKGAPALQNERDCSDSESMFIMRRAGLLEFRVDVDGVVFLDHLRFESHPVCKPQASRQSRDEPNAPSIRLH